MCDEAFVVNAETSVFHEPGDGSFDEPAFWEGCEVVDLGSLDDLEAQAVAYRLNVPFTGHPMIGHDIIYTHPANNCAAIGRTAQRDFLTFAEQVREFEGRVSFCGGIDAQQLLMNGTPEALWAKVTELRSLFPTGLILSPSHEAILADVALENVQAMIDAATVAR